MDLLNAATDLVYQQALEKSSSYSYTIMASMILITIIYVVMHAWSLFKVNV